MRARGEEAPWSACESLSPPGLLRYFHHTWPLWKVLLLLATCLSLQGYPLRAPLLQTPPLREGSPILCSYAWIVSLPNSALSAPH